MERWVAQVLVLAMAWPTVVGAVPLERFETPLQITCQHDTICAKTARSKVVLGGTTGVVLIAGNEGQASLRFTQDGERRLELKGSGEAVHSLILTWDADNYPEQLSGAGLGCFDLTAQDANAFVVRDLAVKGECVEKDPSGTCPPIEIETRIYDADDATGQRFSASVVNRPVPRSAEQLVVPFSNFVRDGPRGLARFSCVGAISMVFRVAGFKDVEVGMGPIFTNGTEGLTYIPSPTPTHTPTATPTSTEVAAEATAAPTVAAEPTAVISPTATSAPSVEATAVPQAFVTQASLEVFEDESLEKVVVPKVLEDGQDPQGRLPAILPENEEEVVYGSVVANSP